MDFNFCRVFISQNLQFCVFTFLNLWLLGTVVLKYVRVKYLGIYGVSPYIIIEYGSCRSANLAGLIGFFEDVIVPGDLGFLGLCDDLVVLAPFHRPHGHQSALLSCSYARSAPLFSVQPSTMREEQSSPNLARCCAWVPSKDE